MATWRFLKRFWYIHYCAVISGHLETKHQPVAETLERAARKQLIMVAGKYLVLSVCALKRSPAGLEGGVVDASC